jgi:hypothetical protein
LLFVNSFCLINQVPGRTYWQNSTYSGVSKFIKAIKDGDIDSQQQKPREKNPFEEFIDRFTKYLPWSLLGLLAMIGGTFYLFLPSGNTVIRPPPPPMVPDISDIRSGSAAAKKEQ